MTEVEKRTMVTPFKVELYCECGSIMEHDGRCLPSYPAQYPHVCTGKDCKNVKNVRGKTYPRIEYVDTEELT